MYKFGIFLALIVAVAFSCSRSGDGSAATDHSEEAHAVGSIQSTLFTDQFEYFIEYDALVSGKPSGFLVHVTQLETYDPVTSGILTIRINDAEITVAAPDRPGIFEANLVPGTPGEQEVFYSLNSEMGNDQVQARAIVKGDHHLDDDATVEDEDDHVHGDDHEEEGMHSTKEAGHSAHAQETGEITFLKEQAWKSDFMVRKVQSVPFSAVVKASGQVLAVPGEKKHLAAQTSGILVFRNKFLVQGSRVEKGQALFTIMAASLGEENFEVRYRELRNNLEQSRSEYRRHSVLFKDRVVSEREYIASETRYMNDSIRFQNLASRATANGLEVTAPISGYIHELNFSEGQYVETGDQVVTISSNRNLLLRADVPMQHYLILDRIVTANFRTGYSERIYDTEELNGTLLSKGSSVAENNHFIPVYFEVTNDGTLLEGAFVEFFLKTKEQEQAIIVPAGAISEEQGFHYCYLQVTGESYTRQAVTLGEDDGKNIRVNTGLKQGDRVVTEGIMLLKAASMVSGDTGHGHAH